MTTTLAKRESDEIPDVLPEQPTGLAAVIERLAANPSVDVEKLERIIALQERILGVNAKAAFTSAFSDLQADIPVIFEKAKTNNGRYAPLEDIVAVIRPILQRHGFSLSHQTEWPDKTTVKVVGILAHRAGHDRRSEFLSAADSSGNKNAIQGLGSAIAYGRRYTTKDLLNIVTTDEDDDGRTSGQAAVPEGPKGFDDWRTDLATVADDGYAALERAWKASLPQYRTFLTKYFPTALDTLKAKARTVQA